MFGVGFIDIMLSGARWYGAGYAVWLMADDSFYFIFFCSGHCLEVFGADFMSFNALGCHGKIELPNHDLI